MEKIKVINGLRTTISSLPVRESRKALRYLGRIKRTKRVKAVALECGLLRKLLPGFIVYFNVMLRKELVASGVRYGVMEAVAEHDFNATAEDELSFRKNQILK
ncbi:unnamed protein product, partial [Brugia timori]|uniref:SH3 domain-containing protein n=1 Tax=Brugia timori TaxID=42155 RepID=A0A0R3QEL7_9BILA